MRSATSSEMTMADMSGLVTRKDGVPHVRGLTRGDRRNLLRGNKQGDSTGTPRGLSKQLRNREHPKYRPVENKGGGMRRHDERVAAKKEAENVAVS